MKDIANLGELARAYLGEQCAVIIDAEGGLREREPIVHPTRVAVRRLRSTIRSYAALFEPERSAALETELVWWAGLLGVVRDLEVLEARLAGQLDELPDELVVGPIRRQLTEEIQTRRQRGWTDIVATLDGERYRTLVAELGAWRTDPPFTERAQAPARKVARYVERATRKLDRRLVRAMAAYESGEPDTDEYFHSARKAGKRARYAVELAAPLWGAGAEQVIADHKDLQDVLGEHQDSIVSGAFLREQGVRVGIRSGHNGFTYGLLHARELARGAAVGDQLKPFLGSRRK